MRIACLQFNPQVGDVNNNMTRADQVLAKYDNEDLDLLVLPEMAFTGYNFKSLFEIYRFLEPTASGISALWARTKALKHNCHVVVGYPEKVDVSHKWPANPEYYNSAVMVGRDGENVAHHRKAFLYYTDETWALEGDKGFYADHITGLGQVAMGICMDINPYKFEAPWHDFEFANHILKCDANLVIFSMAWLTADNASEFMSVPNEPDHTTLAHWAMRLEPLIREKSSDEIIIVFANRCGSEDDVVYAGTSAVLGIRNGQVNVYGVLGRCEKKLLVVDTNDEPVGRLVMGDGEIKLVTRHTGARGSPSQTTSSHSSARPDKGQEREHKSPHSESRDQRSTRSGSIETRPTKETGLNPVVYAPPRQPLHRLASTPSIQRGSPSLTSSLTPDTSEKGKTHPLKLTIPDTSSRSWRKSSETMTGTPAGAGCTPVRKRLKDIWEPQVTRPAPKAPDSAVVLSAVEHPRNGFFSPTDSGIGRATPDTRPRNSTRRSGEHRPSRHKEVPKLDTIVADEEAQGVQTLKDSPVSKPPDSSVLAHWLQTLPTPKDLAAVSNASRTDRETRPVGEGTVSEGFPVCHACGREILKGDKIGVGSKSDKAHISKAVAERQRSKEAAVERESRKSEGPLRPEIWEDGHADCKTQCPDGIERGDIQGGALLQVEEKDNGVLQLQVFGTDEPTRGRTREREDQGQNTGVLSEPKLQGGSNGAGEEKKVSRATADKTIQAGGASLAGVDPGDGKPVKNPELRVNGTETADSRMEKAEREIGDALAPRSRVVPPPVKGMEKVVTVAIRPSSVAW